MPEPINPGATSPHFSNFELRCRGDDCNLIPPLVPLRGCGENRCKQILVDALEALRLLIGKPIIVDSAYRCAKHNAGTPNSAKNSVHVQGLAADIRVIGMTGAQLEAAVRKIPFFKGVGRSDFANYVHADCREEVASWCYAADGKWCSYYPPKVA